VITSPALTHMYFTPQDIVCSLTTCTKHAQLYFNKNTETKYQPQLPIESHHNKNDRQRIKLTSDPNTIDQNNSSTSLNLQPDV
jgi:hypothetical protein